MKNKQLIKLLQAYPSNAIVQINSRKHDKGSENILYIDGEDEHNNKWDFRGQVYIDITGEWRWLEKNI